MSLGDLSSVLESVFQGLLEFSEQDGSLWGYSLGIFIIKHLIWLTVDKANLKYVCYRLRTRQLQVV